MGADYKIIKEIGKGGFGTVYLIEKENKKYALKKIPINIFDNGQTEKYTEEINILSTFNSEYIVKYYDSKINNDYIEILMEYGGTTNLKKFIKAHKDKNQLIEEEIIEYIIFQICLGLKEIHEKKIIHLDLTPENIFMDEFNRIKIGDFGVSKKLVTSKAYVYTKTGKHHYNAPEIELEERFNNKVDIYAFGCIIYELFTLNEYYIDKVILEKDCKIDTNCYKNKWQKLIDLLLEKNYKKRLNIEQTYNYIIEKCNEILLKILTKKEDVGKKINLLNNEEENHKEFNNNLKNLDESNVDLYINNNKCKYGKYFIPEKDGMYIIKFRFYSPLKDCSYLFFNCKNLKKIDLSSFDIKKALNIRNMFLNCNNLQKIKVSEDCFNKICQENPSHKDIIKKSKFNAIFSNESSSICKIKTQYGIGSGFLLKFEINKKYFYCLISGGDTIIEKMIKDNESIDIYYDNYSHYIL